MSYLIEMSFDIIKIGNFLETKKNIIEIANKYNKIFSYNNHEIMGSNRTIYRNHYVMTFVFEDNELSISNFIKDIKSYNKHIYFESVSYECGKFNMMYASKKYLNIMEKCKAKEYLENKKNNTLYKQNSIIIKELLKK